MVKLKKRRKRGKSVVKRKKTKGKKKNVKKSRKPKYPWAVSSQRRRKKKKGAKTEREMEESKRDIFVKDIIIPILGACTI